MAKKINKCYIFFIIAFILFMLCFFSSNLFIPKNSNVSATTGNWCDKNLYYNQYSISKLNEDNGWVLISKPEELGYLAWKINSNSAYMDKNVKLINNIDLKNHYWTPITNFVKIFDGQGYKIENLKISHIGNTAGLFQNISSTGVVKNIIFSDCTVTDISDRNDESSKDTYIGFVSANCLGLIENCRVYGSLLSETKYSKEIKQLWFGGVTAWLDDSGIVRGSYSEINFSYNNSNIILNQAHIGSIVGEAKGKSILETCSANSTFNNINYIKIIQIGGIVGCLRGESSVIKSCNMGQINVGNKNNATISNANVGGIVGYSNSNGRIQGCYNTGKIESYILSSSQLNIDELLDIQDDSEAYFETINFLFDDIGYYKNFDSKFILYYTGKVYTFDNYVGGIIGYCDSMKYIYGCYNIGEIDGTSVIYETKINYCLWQYFQYISCSIIHNGSTWQHNESMHQQDNTIPVMFLPLNISYKKNIGTIIGFANNITKIDSLYSNSFTKYNFECDGLYIPENINESVGEFLKTQLNNVSSCENHKKFILQGNIDYAVETYCGSDYLNKNNLFDKIKNKEFYVNVDKIDNLLKITITYPHLTFTENVKLNTKTNTLINVTEICEEIGSAYFIESKELFTNICSSTFSIDSSKKINNGYPYIKEMHWQNYTNTPKYINIEYTYNSDLTATVKKVNTNYSNLTIPQKVVNPENGITYNVTEIGEYSFAQNEIIQTVVIPNTITKINEFAFYSCIGLQNISIPNGVTEIKHAAFMNCIGLKEITFSKALTTLGAYAFAATSLTIIDLSDCINLKSLNPNGYQFAYCSLLNRTIMPINMPILSKNLFEKCINLNLIIYKGNEVDWFKINPNNVANIKSGTVIDTNSFDYIQNSFTFKYFIVNENIQIRYMSNSQFICEYVEIPKTIEGYSVIQLNANSFDGNMGVRLIVLPDSITTIGQGSFSNCDALKYIIYNGTKEQWKNIKKNGANINKGVIVYCLDGEITIS